MISPTRFRAITALAALLLAACGGGGGGGGSASAPTAATAAPDALQLFPLADAVASPAPGTLGVQDVAMNFTVAGSSQYVLALEPGFTGTFTAKKTGTCAFAAGVTPPDGATAPVSVTELNGTGVGPQAVFELTAVAAGTCVVKVNDGSTTNSAEILVNVTQTEGNVQ